MAKIPDSQTISDLWARIKDRSIPVKSLSKAEYDVLDEVQKNADILYVVFDSSSVEVVYKGVSVITGGQTTMPVKAPIGCILWWSGTAENVPDGWHLCDGTNGTLNLSGYFLLSAGNGHNVGETGGSEEVTLTVEQMPQHNHQIGAIASTGSANSFARGGGTSDTMFGTSYKGSSKPHPNMPPYYTLCAIQKISADETDLQTDDTLTLEDGTLGVTTPVQSILTQAEFDALSEEQQNKGLYVISDGGSSGSGTSENVYSTEETRIGTWIDGKPLYRKAIEGSAQIGSMSNAAIGTFPDLVNAVFRKIEGVYGQNNGTIFHSIPETLFGGSTASIVSRNVAVNINNTNGAVFLTTHYSGSSPINVTYTLIFEYTKTTD